MTDCIGANNLLKWNAKSDLDVVHSAEVIWSNFNGWLYWIAIARCGDYGHSSTYKCQDTVASYSLWGTPDTIY